MAAHGIASIVTIVGGAAFVVIAIRALAPPGAAGARHERHGRRARAPPRMGGARRPARRSALRSSRCFRPGARRRDAGFVELLKASRRSSAPSSTPPGGRCGSRISAAGRSSSTSGRRGASRASGDAVARPARRPPAGRDFAVVAVTKDPVGDSPSRRTFDRMGLKRLAPLPRSRREARRPRSARAASRPR